MTRLHQNKFDITCFCNDEPIITSFKDAIIIVLLSLDIK